MNTEAKPQNDGSLYFTPGPLTLSENLLAWSMSQLRSLVLSVKDIRRRLWYSQRVKIKAESLSSSCSANSHFPWQQLKGGVWILLFFLWSHLSPHVQSFMSYHRATEFLVLVFCWAIIVSCIFSCFFYAKISTVQVLYCLNTMHGFTGIGLTLQ